MRVLAGLTALVSFVFTGFASAAVGRSPAAEREFAEFDDRIHAELRRIDPAAESILREADAAREREDHRAAADLYAKVVAAAPTFTHALRRQAGEELALGDRAGALGHFERALAQDDSADNRSALARALVSEKNPNEAERSRARDLARSALVDGAGNYYVAATAAMVAMPCQDLPLLDAATAALARIAPDDGLVLYLTTIAQASHGRHDDALASLERAHAAGMPDAEYRSLRASIEKSRPLGSKLARWGTITAVAWIGGGVVLLVTGMILSAMTLRSAERSPTQPEASATGMEALLRRVYRFVLWGSCAYYYLSMPILFALVLVAGGGVLYGMVRLGHIPLKLFLIVLIITIVTATSILRSLIVRRRDEDPGTRLDLEREPALRDLLKDVAARVGTRPVDSVYMTPGTEVAVFERGGVLGRLRGRGERCLILGTGALEGLSLGPFRAVLAHEYGHFSNRDTAGGGFALTVRISVLNLARNLAAGGAAAWYNPAWLFVNGFHRLFLRISQGASRLQEVLADRWAAILYGAQAFEDGLRHVIERSVRFDAHVKATLSEVVEKKRPLANLYGYAPATPLNEAKLVVDVRSAIESKPSPYDSHPCPTDRFRWVHALGVRVTPAPDDTAPVWSLFTDRQALEEEMTGVVRAAIRENHQIWIAAA